MRIYYINADCGDGSSRTEFYDSKECIDYLTDDDRFLEEYMDGDGGSWGYFDLSEGATITFPHGKVRTMEDIKAEYGD